LTVVLDSSVWISALQFDGIPSRVLLRAATVDTILFCAQIEEEVLRTMLAKFNRPPSQIKPRLTAFLETAEWITVTGTVTGVCRDPNDDFLLECAIKGHAGFIVTGDKDLLSIKTFEGTRILTPREYLDEVSIP